MSEVPLWALRSEYVAVPVALRDSEAVHGPAVVCEPQAVRVPETVVVRNDTSTEHERPFNSRVERCRV